MKGCARSCILLLLAWSVAAYAFYRYFVEIRDFGPPMYWGSAFAGLFLVASVGFAYGIGTAHRERRMLLDAIAGTPPADGQWVGVSGAIASTRPLTAPFSGETVVAYAYRIHREQRVGRTMSDIVYYDGKALAPSTIASRQGSVRLLCVPAFTDIPAESIDPSKALQRARAYVAGTAFTILDTAEKRLARMDHERIDDDGEYRLDRKYSELAVDLAEGFQFEEKHIRQGEQVCAFGLYSRARGGLIPHPNWAKETRVVRGDSSHVAEKLRRRMINYFVGSVIYAGLVFAIVWFYRYQAATLPR